ncbi:MAG: hypothetical protein AAGE98_18940 [Actinomycetota bacterium]
MRLAYRQLISGDDPARSWLAAGMVDARFAGDDVPAASVVRGPDDLVELHDIVDDLFGVGCFPRPAAAEGELASTRLAVSRPAAVMPFLESLRPHLDGRGPAFWTWKTAREAMAVRLQALDAVTIEAVRT